MSGVFNCLEDKWAAESGGRREAAVAAFPSLSKESHLNQSASDRLNELTGSHRKSQEVIKLEVKALAEIHGLERLGFLTLTFSEQVCTWKEANRQFNSLLTHVLKPRYVCGLIVRERSARGRCHFHLVVVLNSDIRTGVDFEAFAQKPRGDYRSASPELRAEWDFLRETLPRYGDFGRHELLPVKSNAEGLGEYLGQYIGKHIFAREVRDKGARLVSFFGYEPGRRRASPHFAWSKGASLVWRLKTASFAAGLRVKEFEELGKRFGPRWAYYCQDQIMKQVLSEEVIRKFNLFEEAKGLVTQRTNGKKGTDRTGADHPNATSATPQGSSPGAAAVEGVYTVPTTIQGGGKVPVGCRTLPVSPRTVPGRGARAVEGVMSTQRTTNQNASPCQPEAKNFPDSGKKRVARSMAEFQAAWEVKRLRLSVESVWVQQQIGFPHLAGTEAGQKETHSQKQSLDGS